VPLEVGGSCPALSNSRHPPDPSLGEARLETGRLPSSAVVLSAECHRDDEPLRLPARLPPEGGSRGATSHQTGSPVLPCVRCGRATPLTPASESMVIGRVLTWTPAAFPVMQAGRPSRRHVRNLRKRHTYCGPSACCPTHGGPLSRGFQSVGYPCDCLGSDWGVPTTPQTGLAPVRHTAPIHGALKNSG
jgi:hypothetical protein